MIKRLIFDIDGTLITNVNFYKYIDNALKRYGVNDSNKTKLFLENIGNYEKYYNCYDKDLYLEFFSKKLNYKLDYRFLDIFFDELKEAVSNNSEKIKKVLSKLTGYEMVLLSNYFEESQRNRLNTMKINKYFTEYYGEKLTKPNEYVYTLSRGNYKPEECVIIGDDEILDIEIPKKLGFNTIHVGQGKDINSICDLSLEKIKRLERNI